MTIPLNRLYHYLDSLCNEDIIIYRWDPHGSKKIHDLGPYKHIATNIGYQVEDLIKLIITPTMICHDQEPLDFGYYSESYVLDFLSSQTFFGTPIGHEFFKKQSSRNLSAVSSLFSIYDYTLLCHSEKNSKQLELYEKNYFVGVYYWSHALIAKDWFRFAEHDDSLTLEPSEIKYDFLIYNRAWSGTREYRLKFAEMLIETDNLIDSCNIKFNAEDNNINYKDHVFKNKQLQIQNTKLEYSILQNTSPSWASADYNGDDYKQCAVEVVLETIFDDNRNHLTEKTLRPIACGKPFILTSSPNSLAYLRQYGFKTFDGLIDESYDIIEDPVDRLFAIVSEMKRIAELPYQDKICLLRQLYQIADYNKQHFFSSQFHNFVIKEFIENFHKGLDKVKNTKNKTWYNMFKNCDTLQSSEEFQITLASVESLIN